MKPTNLFKHLLPSLWERVREGLLLLCLMVMGATEVKAATYAYAFYSSTYKSITFYYDDQYDSHIYFDTSVCYKLTESGLSNWLYNHRSGVENVIFDESFANYYISSYTNASRWFDGFSDLRSVTGLQNIKIHFNDMSYMFSGCSSLTSLDLSDLNTWGATNMSYMFSGCSSLTFLDVSGFDTQYVHNMSNMFEGCSSLTSLDVSNFNTANVTNMYQMFKGCSSLTSLDVSSFNTSNVTNMYQMFYGCSGLTSLDVSNFDTSNVTNMGGMFNGCSALTTIYCSDSWSPSSSTDMFTGCTSLVSESSGLSYDSSKTSSTYANPSTGYFTSSAAPYAVYTGSNNTLTFYYDNQRAIRPGTSYYLNSGEDLPGWVNDEKNAVVQHVVFDPSFDTARPTYTNAWFAGMTNLQDITGMEYLHTDEVTYMRSMFQDASSLTSLDLTTFNTAKVTNMVNMFFGCTGLTSLYLTSFNTENVTSMASMFRKCSSLTSLDLSSFNTKKVEDMSFMFNTCSALTTIIAGDDWSTSAVVNSGAMFTSCPNLKGRNGTTFDSNHTDAEYARFDNAPSSPGYLSDINSASTQEVSLNLEIWGVGAMRLIDKDGNIVKSLSNDESSTVSTTVRWTKGTRMLMEVTAPAGYDLSHSSANLFIDGVPRTLGEDTDEDGNIYFSYYVSNVYEPHSYILIFTGLESTAASTDITWRLVVAGAPDYYVSIQSDGDPIVESCGDKVAIVTDELLEYFSDIYVGALPGYTFKISFNGEDLTYLMKYKEDSDGMRVYANEQSLQDILPLVSTSGTWVVEFEKQGVTWNLIAAGEVPDDCSADIGMDGMSLEITVDKNTSQESQTYYDNPMGYNVSAIVSCPAGYTYKLWFNGIDYSSRFTEDNGYTIDDEEELRSLVTDGTWVVEFKKGITWTAVATGDVAEGMANLGVEIELNNQDDLELVEVKLSPSNTHNTGTFNFGVSDGDITPTQMHAWIYCKPGYELSSVTFNGVEYRESFDIQTSGVNPFYQLNLDIDDDLSPFLVDGTWVVEFKKEGFTWDVYTTGDVAVGNYIELEVNDAILEYAGNSGYGDKVTYSSGTHSVDTPREMWIYVTVKPGYEFKLLHNGVSVEGFTMDSSSSTSECWTYSIDEQSELLPLLTDGTWVIEFSYKNKKYDVNEDGQVSIADVTKLVNKILGKE